ncbi:hypothetical protein C3747_14g333 [Trypanosoma cruzi]|uniref:Tyrosine specific protein phosphatases domain-containing protein n=2 Tax=Trypanosoma cruzi TaxID=5693 RepID=Q4DHH3_TRYCC|nr:hypothetical protein, conserved [Trypanosoma cruzi]EAN91975.1 hypothetical protein, conserved [Trypanosoma cruzi]PWV18238.1 hypothetical protein C3747_14g333 [Trypanosoma cruzi]|eukprot:XP_813826.1 hypothetical protein [Trypanosoma cruzi strain CL Brener]
MTEVYTTPEVAAGEGRSGLFSAATPGRMRSGVHDSSALPETKTIGASVSSFQEPHGAACGDTDTSHERPLWIEEEDIAFFFAAMTWNVELLEVLLSRAENPLLSDVAYGGSYDCQQQQQATRVPEEENVTTLARAAFPTLEEALLTASAAMRTPPRGKSRLPGGNHSRRSKRRRIGRGHTTQLTIYSTFLYEARVEVDYEDEVEDEKEEVAWESKKYKKSGRGKFHFTTQAPYKCGAIKMKKEKYAAYSTEEEFYQSDVPQRCLEAHDNFHAAAISETTANNVTVPAGPVLQGTILQKEDEKGKEKTQQSPPCPPVTIRDFFRLFFQSFLIVVVAKLRYQEEPASSNRRSNPLSPLESRALCFVRRYRVVFKEILRRHVMGSEKEVERRATQSLLVDAFQCDEARDGNWGAGWKPSYSQVYISGREPVYQPLLLDFLNITRVVQCYANPPQSDVNDFRGIGGSKDMALNKLYCWRRLLLEGSDMSQGNLQNVKRAGSLFLCGEEQEVAYELLRKCLSPLAWEPYRTFGPYMIYTAELPCSSRLIAKLVIPAEDQESYDLSQHFQEGVFCFLHGIPFFPFDAARSGPQNVPSLLPRCCSLVHCSAGMHRSSGLAIAYLLWLVALSCGELPVVRDSVDLLVKKNEEGQGRQYQTIASYLSVFLGNRGKRPNTTETMAADVTATPTSLPLPAAAGDVWTDAEGSHVEKHGNEIDSVANNNTSILELCVEHVRRQRSMAVPISAVRELLRRYACCLHLQ